MTDTWRNPVATINSPSMSIVLPDLAHKIDQAILLPVLRRGYCCFDSLRSDKPLGTPRLSSAGDCISGNAYSIFKSIAGKTFRSI